MWAKTLLLIALVLAVSCVRPKDGQIVAAVVTAELAQTLDTEPGDIEVEQVRFQGRRHAEVEVVRKMAGGRFSQRVGLLCEVGWENGRWHVLSTRPREL